MSFTARRISMRHDEDGTGGDVVFRGEEADRPDDFATLDDRTFVSRAAALEEAYRLAQISLASQLEATLDQVLAAALARIGIELPPEQRLRVVCEQLAKVAGPAPGACLRLSTADACLYHAAALRSPWPLQIDDALLPGDCRLATDRGEWALSFDALIASLGPVMSSSTPNRNTTDDCGFA